MKAEVTSDRSTRTISFEITDGPELNDESATWRSKPRPFRAERARLMIEDGQIYSMNVSGHRVLKGGRLSDTERENVTWRMESSRNNLDQAPNWVREIACQAPNGITEYTWTAEELAEP